MSTLVMKFGGTSVGSPAAILQTAQIIQNHKSDWDNLVVVVSAMSGITDKLILSARLAADNDGAGAREIITQNERQHLEVVNTLVSGPTEKHNLLAVSQIFLVPGRKLSE